MNRRNKQGVGGFNLPDRASDGSGGNKGFNLRHLWFVNERVVHDMSVNINQNHFRQQPLTDAVSINVNAAFNSGGAQDKANGSENNYNLRDLVIYTARRW